MLIKQDNPLLKITATFTPTSSYYEDNFNSSQLYDYDCDRNKFNTISFTWSGISVSYTFDEMFDDFEEFKTTKRYQMLLDQAIVDINSSLQKIVSDYNQLVNSIVFSC